MHIEDLDGSNIDDLIFVCSSKRLGDAIHQEGMSLKRQWLREMLDAYGPCAKVAYYRGRPVAQILYFPEAADRTRATKREGVLTIHCTYNPVPGAQRMGIGRKLVNQVIEDAKQRRTCLGNQPCRFIVARSFDTGEFLSLPKFYERCSFVPAVEAGKPVFYLPVEGAYEPAVSAGEYVPLEKDQGKVVIFYGPMCQFGYPFAKTIEKLVRDVASNVRIEMINEWEHPRESIERKNWWLVVNAKPIHAFFMDTENFKREVKEALG